MSLPKTLLRIQEILLTVFNRSGSGTRSEKALWILDLALGRVQPNKCLQGQIFSIPSSASKTLKWRFKKSCSMSQSAQIGSEGESGGFLQLLPGAKGKVPPALRSCKRGCSHGSSSEVPNLAVSKHPLGELHPPRHPPGTCENSPLGSPVDKVLLETLSGG